uniref:Tetratricopeptide repeat-containing protein n=1 Tax=Candidatus Kentrum eta TaxID=2126337 RepID=A0A450UI65_9GAMM|nr:MAG: hypothetical protein BECKH772A_GA0070896_1002815 [Candidatus Kentron sp. H]VFJ92229.1 MAG: hypothetical protein BECKH772B_GA0070898_1002615 [Candidatus Kentron sp. H]VFJ98889.1 MAG: hypothetical protein BECKH772C_GA0070978_1002615 [Candidatus Kentron sp. H]
MAANPLGNLGLIAWTRGELAKAEAYWRRALALFTQVGMGPEMETVAGWLEGLARPRGTPGRGYPAPTPSRTASPALTGREPGPHGS